MALYLTPKGRRIFTTLGLTILTIVIVTAIYLSVQNKKNEFRTVNDPQKAKEVALSLKETVSKIYVVPPEDPTVATVTDKKVLPQNSFYAKAENGDKILIFEASQKILLYRPSINKVVDVAEIESPKEIPVQDVAGTSSTDTSTPSAIFQSEPKVIFNKAPEN